MIQQFLGNLHIEGIYALLTVAYVLIFGSVLFRVFWKKSQKYMTDMASMPLLEEKQNESK